MYLHMFCVFPRCRGPDAAATGAGRGLPGPVSVRVPAGRRPVQPAAHASLQHRLGAVPSGARLLRDVGLPEGRSVPPTPTPTSRHTHVLGVRIATFFRVTQRFFRKNKTKTSTSNLVGLNVKAVVVLNRHDRCKKLACVTGLRMPVGTYFCLKN